MYMYPKANIFLSEVDKMNFQKAKTKNTIKRGMVFTAKFAILDREIQQNLSRHSHEILSALYDQKTSRTEPSQDLKQ